MTQRFRPSLFGRLFAANAVVYIAGALVLALSPATISVRVLASEAVVLAVGLAALLLVNGLLLRAGLAPLERLVRDMATFDPTSPDTRPEQGGSPPVSTLVSAYNEMVDRLRSERASSAARVLVGQEQERHRVARELHDQIGQSLTVVLLGLQRCRDAAGPGLDALLQEVQEYTRAALDEVSEVARRLRPGVLEDLGLGSALSGLVTDFTKATGVPARRVTTPGLPELEEKVELAVYRVAQEALTNIARHADAHHVELRLTRQGRRLVLEVVDDGRGMELPKNGVGLAGMSERAMLAGGSLHVDSSPGRGTTVRLEVPLDD